MTSVHDLLSGTRIEGSYGYMSMVRDLLNPIWQLRNLGSGSYVWFIDKTEVRTFSFPGRGYRRMETGDSITLSRLPLEPSDAPCLVCCRTSALCGIWLACRVAP